MIITGLIFAPMMTFQILYQIIGKLSYLHPMGVKLPHANSAKGVNATPSKGHDPLWEWESLVPHGVRDPPNREQGHEG